MSCEVINFTLFVDPHRLLMYKINCFLKGFYVRCVGATHCKNSYNKISTSFVSPTVPILSLPNRTDIFPCVPSEHYYDVTSYTKPTTNPSMCTIITFLCTSVTHVHIDHFRLIQIFEITNMVTVEGLKL